MYQLKLIVKHAALDQQRVFVILCPVQQFFNQLRNIRGQCAEMQDIALRIHHTDRSQAELSGIVAQTSYHNGVRCQQVVYRIRVQLVKPVIDFKGVLHLRDVLRRRQYALARHDRRDLIQAKCVLLDRQRGIDGLNAVASS